MAVDSFPGLPASYAFWFVLTKWKNGKAWVIHHVNDDVRWTPSGQWGGGAQP